MDRKSIENTINAADDWSNAARRDIETYKSLVRSRIFPFIDCKPREPHMALHHLQQSIEKMVKAVAIASGKFSYKDVRNYGHDSLSLYADVMENLIETPSVKDLINSLQGQLKKKSEVTIISHDEAYQTLEKVKANIQRKGKAIPDWYLEFALLPEKPIKSIINSKIKGHNKIRFLRFILRLIPDRLFDMKRGETGKSMGIASKLLSKRGYLVNKRVEQYFSKDEVKSFFNKSDKENKINIIKMLREIIMPSIVLGELLILSAFTFAHGVSTRYPGNRLDNSDPNNIFNDTLYDNNLGVVRCLTKLGKLTELVFKEMDEVIVYTVDIFEFFNSMEYSRNNNDGSD